MARGQPVDARAEALVAFESGVLAFEAQDYAAARTAFERALELKPFSSSIRRNLGIAEVFDGHYAHGAQRLTRFLRAEQELDATTRARITQTLAIATQHLERVSLVSAEPGVTVYIDGELIGKTPIAGAWYVAPGSFMVSAEKQGFRPLSERHTAEPGHARTILLELIARSTPASALGQAAAFAQADPQRHSNGWAYGLFVTSAVGLSVGTWALLRGSGLQRDANVQFARACSTREEAASPECAAVASLDRKAAAMRTAAALGFGTSGAALLGGVLLYSSKTHAPHELKRSARLWIGPTDIAVTGTF